MMRRKLWASIASCLVLGGMASAQETPSKPASLGKPQPVPNYTARGTSPDYPIYNPAPYRSATPTGPIRTSSFAVDGDAQPKTPEKPPLEIPKVGMPMPMNPSVIAPPVPDPKDPKDKPPMTGNTIPPPMITTMPPAPYLDGSGMYGYPSMACAPDGTLPRVWIAPEYIHWKTRGVQLPPMVTTAPAGARGVLGDPTTSIVYGNQTILDNWRSGLRVRAGAWFDRTGGTGIDVGFFYLGGTQNGFSAESTGSPTGLFRPFTNASIGQADAQLIGLNLPDGTPIIAGRTTHTNMTQLLGAEANIRQVLNNQNGNHLDVLIGYRYLRLRDTLSVRDDVVITDPLEQGAPLGTEFTVFDRFETINQFHGVNFGVAGEWKSGKFFVNYRASVAVGVTHMRTKIDGATQYITPAGENVFQPGGLLAVPTNMGSYSDYRCTIIPEVGLNVGYEVSQNLRVFAGYNVLYWSNVARAGEQIDSTVNSTYVPFFGGDNPSGIKRPAFDRKDANFWAHGWNLGVEFRW